MNEFSLLLLLAAVILSVNSQSRGNFHQIDSQNPQYYNAQQRSVNLYNRPLQQQQQFPPPPAPSQQQQQYAFSQPNFQQQQQIFRPSPNNQKVISQITPGLQQQSAQRTKPTVINQRFNEAGMLGDDASVSRLQGPDFTTRRPSTNRGQRPTQPDNKPPEFNTRFDDYNSRTLMWDEQLSINTEKFALTLFAILTHYETENIMISPYSIHSLLVVLAEGAGGNTYKQLNDALGLINRQRTRDFHQYSNLALNKSSADVSFRKFSAMIGDRNRPVQREYEDNVEKIYDVDYIPVNFQDVENVLREVNGKVSQNTNGQINDAISREDVLKAQLILLSGIHFRGNWKSVFNNTFTKSEPFYDINQERVTGRVNMMFQRGPFAYTANQNLGCYLLELPYGPDPLNKNENGDDRISMIVVLPKRGLPLLEAIDNVNKYGIKSLLVELKKAKEDYEDEEVEVHLPRFEMDTSLNLVQTLQDMDITDIFDQQTANLSGINNNYYVASILHKTKIRVDERGTEASAVSTSIFANKATPPKFHANRPFFYFIVDKATRLVLFAGVYKNPSLF